MKKEESKFITLTPDEGKVLYNGDMLSECVFLPLTADISVWREISAEEADEIRAEQERAMAEEEEEDINLKQ